MTEWALPLVVRIEKAAPPTRTDALEAAAVAVLRMITDGRAEWAEPLAAWAGSGRIRKVVRRARGAGWDRAVLLDGITVQHGTALVRVFPPVPVDDWPPDLGRLQVGGTELDDPEPPGQPAPGPVIWLAPDVEMSAGKAMAQAGHAAQLGWWASSTAGRAAWAEAGFATAVRTADPARWARLGGLPAVRDAGFTEVTAGAQTAVADLPWLRPRPGSGWSGLRRLFRRR